MSDPTRTLIARVLPCWLAMTANVQAESESTAKDGVATRTSSTSTGSDEPKPTFLYTTPVEKNYLRAVLEFQGVFVVGLLYYVTTTDKDWDLGYRWDTYEHKFRWEAIGIDHNHFGTNFMGHPLGGSGYYVAARMNRLSAFESFAFAFGGSLLWEYFGEITERVSLNDMIVTPFAGVAIGEATAQLGAFFDRSSPELHHRVLGATFGPFKSVNDWADRLELARVPSGFPKDEWHRFDLALAGVGLTHRSDPGSSPATGGVHIHLGERLARLPHLAEPGSHSFWFDDGNVSSMLLEGVVTPEGLTDLSYRARVMLAGHYSRHAEKHKGGGSVIGPSTTFEYSLHDYGRFSDEGFDRIALVQPVGLGFLHRVWLGETELATEVHVGPALGGLNAHAFREYRGDTDALPEVLPLHRYYFGAGALGTSDIEVSFRSLEFTLGVRAEGYEALQDSPPRGDVTIRDARLRATTGLAFRPGASPFTVRALGRHTSRHGTMGRAHAESVEFMWGLSLGGVF